MGLNENAGNKLEIRVAPSDAVDVISEREVNSTKHSFMKIKPGVLCNVVWIHRVK